MMIVITKLAFPIQEKILPDDSCRGKLASVKLRWSFEIEREVGQGRPRTLKQTVSVELVLVNYLFEFDHSFSQSRAHTGLSSPHPPYHHSDQPLLVTNPSDSRNQFNIIRHCVFAETCLVPG